MKRRRWRSQSRRSLCAAALPAVLALIVGCDRLDMYDQPRYKPLAASDFFADGLSARPRVEGTIARGELHDDEPLYTGKEAGILVSQIPQAAYRCGVRQRSPPVRSAAGSDRASRPAPRAADARP